MVVANLHKKIFDGSGEISYTDSGWKSVMAAVHVLLYMLIVYKFTADENKTALRYFISATKTVSVTGMVLFILLFVYLIYFIIRTFV